LLILTHSALLSFCSFTYLSSHDLLHQLSFRNARVHLIFARMTKSCLKCTAGASHVLYKQPDSPSSPSSPSEQGLYSDSDSRARNRKSVTFTEEGEEEVFYVDDWDRSPAAVTERLTYKDVYELKELHISLPRINLATNRTKQHAKCVT